MALVRCPKCGRVADGQACFACGHEWSSPPASGPPRTVTRQPPPIPEDSDVDEPAARAVASSPPTAVPPPAAMAAVADASATAEPPAFPAFPPPAPSPTPPPSTWAAHMPAAAGAAVVDAPRFPALADLPAPDAPSTSVPPAPARAASLASLFDGVGAHEDPGFDPDATRVAGMPPPPAAPVANSPALTPFPSVGAGDGGAAPPAFPSFPSSPLAPSIAPPPVPSALAGPAFGGPAFGAQEFDEATRIGGMSLAPPAADAGPVTTLSTSSPVFPSPSVSFAEIGLEEAAHSGAPPSMSTAAPVLSAFEEIGFDEATRIAGSPPTPPSSTSSADQGPDAVMSALDDLDFGEATRSFDAGPSAALRSAAGPAVPDTPQWGSFDEENPTRRVNAPDPKILADETNFSDLNFDDSAPMPGPPPPDERSTGLRAAFAAVDAGKGSFADSDGDGDGFDGNGIHTTDADLPSLPAADARGAGGPAPTTSTSHEAHGVPAFPSAPSFAAPDEEFRDPLASLSLDLSFSNRLDTPFPSLERSGAVPLAEDPGATAVMTLSARVGVLAALLENEGRITDATLLYEVQGALTERGL